MNGLPEREELLGAAGACGEWMLANQVDDHRFDANRGRGLSCFDLSTGGMYYTSGWLTGTMCMALLALHRRTGTERYLDAAICAGHYIMSLQVMDSRDRRYYGAMREHTPQSVEFCPRDAVTAAWALIWLYNSTQDPAYLDRVALFGHWHLRECMRNGWPLYMCFMDDSLMDVYRKGSFQSGVALFFHDLFMASGESLFIERGMQPIVRAYRDDFFEDDGSIIQTRDRFTNQVLDIDDQQARRGMHFYNDDFGNAALQCAADSFGDESYREAALRNARWLAGRQDDDGGFGDCHSAVPVSSMYFHDLGMFYNDRALLTARDRAAHKLLSMQVRGVGEPRIDGAFRGAYASPKKLPEGGKGLCVNMRTTSYAVMALLKLESDLTEIWLGRHNKRFSDRIPDPLEDYLHW
ncbi:hypothetical protein ACFLSJ_05160 [Verrucomicrobiota bacterium]